MNRTKRRQKRTLKLWVEITLFILLGILCGAMLYPHIASDNVTTCTHDYGCYRDH